MSEYESIKARRERERKEKAERLKIAQNRRLISRLEEPLRDRLRRERAERIAVAQGLPKPAKDPIQDIRDFAAAIIRKKLPAPAPDNNQQVQRNNVELPGAANIPAAPDKRQKRDIFPGGKNLNVHVRFQAEGTDPDGWVMDPPASITTLCWRNGLFVGSFEQVSTTTIVETFAAIEAAAPADLISINVSNVAGVS